MNFRIPILLTVWFFCVSHMPVAGQNREPAVNFLMSHGDSVWVKRFFPVDPSHGAKAVLIVPGWPAVGKDVLGLGAALSSKGIHVLILHPRGHSESRGQATFQNALEDVAVVWNWMSSLEGGRIDPDQRVLLGYSWGGGIALAFAAQDISVRRVASIAGSDHGSFIRRVDRDSAYGSFMRRVLESTRAPGGPVRFDVESALEELRTHHKQHDLVTVAPRLVDRDVLIVAGWDDREVELEHQVLPFYRALRTANSTSVAVLSYQDDHALRKVRQEMAEAIFQWIQNKQ